jgi:hypothetical protein
MVRSWPENPGVLLEEVVECAAGGAGRRRVGRALNRLARLPQRAGVLGILHGDPLCHRLHALEPCAWVEVGALAAGVRLHAALRAAIVVPVRRGHLGSASRAANHLPGRHQVRRSRAFGPFAARRRAAGARRFLRGLPVTVVVLIAALAVLAVGHRPEMYHTAPRGGRGGRSRPPILTLFLRCRAKLVVGFRTIPVDD